jgi:hypothetical protein
VRGRRVAQGDVLVQVVGLEDGSGSVDNTFGRNAIGVGVDGGHPPPVAVADLVDRVGGTVLDAALRRLKLATVRRNAAEVLQVAKTQRWS